MQHALLTGPGSTRPLPGLLTVPPSGPLSGPLSGLLSRSLASLSLAAGLLAMPAAQADTAGYAQYNLVSDGSTPAEHKDPTLVHARGIAFSPTGLAWVATGGGSLSSIYDGLGNSLPLSAAGVDIPGGRPTGIVTNDGEDFLIPVSSDEGEPSALIFATEAGIISGWSPDISEDRAVAMVDNSSTGASYRGLALAANGLDRFLYATNFSGGRVDVFDADFEPVDLPAGAFQDPDLPEGFSPFGIHNLQGSLYISYARRNTGGTTPLPGTGQGLVNVFDSDGRFIRRLATGGQLNAPWGMALAPANFGPYSNHLLVANHGDGKISAFELASGEFKGQVLAPDQQPLAIDGLWDIRFGNGVQEQPTNVLFFTAAPGTAGGSVYGRIQPEAAPRLAGETAAQPGSGKPPSGALSSGDSLSGEPPRAAGEGLAAPPPLVTEDLSQTAAVKTVNLEEAQAGLPAVEKTSGKVAGAAPGATSGPAAVARPAVMEPIHLETPYPYQVPAME